MKTSDFIKEQKQRIDNGDTLRRGQKACASVFATNDRIYSYGYHYPLLFPVQSKSHGLVWVCNTGGYSATTGKHIGYSNYLADVSAPIGGTNGVTVTIDTVIDSLSHKIDECLSLMASKKRTDTQVYMSIEREYFKARNDLDLLTI